MEFLLSILATILAIVALVKISSLRQMTLRLEEQLEKARSRLAAAETTIFEMIQSGQASAKPAAKASAKAAKAVVEVKAEAVVEQAKAVPNVASSSPAAKIPLPTSKRDVEKTLASQWFIWLGGAAIAISGLFLVRYAHELLPPMARVIAGWVLGGVLVYAGEWLRKNHQNLAGGYVPAAVSAAGLVTAFGATYAAYALYNILSPAVCFPLLVAIGISGFWLSLRQGPLIAALGLIGAYGAPVLVPSDNPNAFGFFALLLVIAAAAYAVLRLRNWWWLGHAATLGAVGWGVMWLNGFGGSDAVVLGTFAILLGAAATFVPRDRNILAAEMGNLRDLKSMTPPMWVAVVGIAAASVLVAGLVKLSGHGLTSLLIFAVAMALVTAFGWLRKGMVAAPLAAAMLSLVVLTAWPNVGFHSWAMNEQGFWSTVPGLVEPPRYRLAMFAALIAFTVVGFIGVLKREEKTSWAILAAAAPVLFLFCAWARADFTLSNIIWAAEGFGFAAALVFLADRYRAGASYVAGILLSGATLLTVFALDRLLNGVWLTLAIAILAFALAFATRRAALVELAALSSGVASFAALRLFIGREIWGPPENLPLGNHWMLYGYGVPALLFWQASRLLLNEKYSRYRIALEGLAIGLAISLVSLELRVLISGDDIYARHSLLEYAAHALAWLGAAYGLAYREKHFTSFISFWGVRALVAASLALIVYNITLGSPLLTQNTVQGPMLINALWLAYLAPIPLLLLLRQKFDGLTWLKTALPPFCLLLLMVFVTLQIKRITQGPQLDIAMLTDVESYSISMSWLAIAVALFVAGIRFDRQSIRYGGLAIMIITILKIFLMDLSNLSGIARILSFMVLGLCLIGIGWLYTKYVQKPENVEYPEKA